MNISNNIASENVSNLIASSISKLNLNSAKKISPNSGIETNIKKQDNKEEIREESFVLPDEKPKVSVDVDDIQKYAQMVGEKVSVDDINYGIRYGRSVIADYIA